LVKKALAKLDPQCQAALINVRPGEVLEYKKSHAKLKLLECSSLREGLSFVDRDTYLIIEDIVTMTKKDEEALRTLINYRAHHDRIRVICVAHMLFRNYLLTLVPLFNYLIFTLSNSSRNLLKTAAVYGFHLEPAKTAKWLSLFSKFFSKHGRDGSYIFISCSSVELYSSQNEKPELLDGNDDDDDDYDDDDDDDDDDVANKKKPLRVSKKRLGQGGGGSGGKKSGGGGSIAKLEERFADCFIDQNTGALARAFFSIIAQVLVKQAGFRSQDLSLAFNQTRKPGRLRRVSVVDYVSSLLDSRPLASPRLDHLVLHRFLSEHCKIPKLFVRNSYFYDAAADITSDELDEEELEEEEEESKRQKKTGENAKETKAGTGL